MNSWVRFLAVVCFVLMLSACSKGNNGDIVTGPYTPAISSSIKVSVADVSNDTHDVFSVDIIGLMWNGMEESLRKRGMLWAPSMGGKPYALQAHILKFREGSAPARLLPWAGDTVLVVSCELRNGDSHLATIDSKQKIAYGSSVFTRSAWRKLFTDASEEIVTQAIRNIK